MSEAAAIGVPDRLEGSAKILRRLIQQCFLDEQDLGDVSGVANVDALQAIAPVRGSMFLALGIVAALLERERSGRGQIIDASIIDGVASLLTFFAGLFSHGAVSLDRDQNFLGGAAPFYRCYRCADGKEIAIGAIESRFYAELLERIGCGADFVRDQNDPATWSRRSEQLAATFATKTRDDWSALLEGSDACFAPVLTLQESFAHPHIKARDLYTQRDGYHHAAAAPRFSRTPGAIDPAPPAEALLRRWLG